MLNNITGQNLKQPLNLMAFILNAMHHFTNMKILEIFQGNFVT